jgi:hypothetical protein
MPRRTQAPPSITIQVEEPKTRWGRIFAILALIGVLGGIWWYALRTRGVLDDLGPDEPIKTEVDGAGAGAWTARLMAAGKDWKEGAKAIAALAQLDPAVLQTASVAKAAGAVAAEAAKAPDGKAIADEVFENLAQKFGAEGLDVLYTLVDSKSGDAAKRALSHLRRANALSKATPALRITMELRDAPCEFQHDLFERAGAEGDARTLALMTELQKRCPAPKDQCCFTTDKVLAKAIADLRARTKK